MRQTILSILLSTTVIYTSIAQNITDFIPKDNSFVMTINMANILKKSDIEKVRAMSFFKDFDATLSQTMANSYSLDKNIFNTMFSTNNPYGIDLNNKIYFIYQNNDSIENKVLYIPLSDPKAFEELVKNSISVQKIEIKTEKHYKWLKNDKSTIAWNDKFAILTNLDMTWSYYYDKLEGNGSTDQYIEELTIEEQDAVDTTDQYNYQYSADYYTEAQAKKKKLETKWATSKIKALMNLDTKNTVSNNVNFQTAQAKEFDIQFWMDYTNYTSLYKGMYPLMGIDKSLTKLTDNLMNIYHDSYISINLNSSKGKLELTTETHVNEELKKLYSNVYDVKLSPNFGKYINQENLLGYFGFAINIKKTVEASKNIILPALQESDEYGKMAKSILELADIIVDEETLYNIFKGDFIMAFTDIKEQEVTYTDYEYDEDFNYTPVEKTRKEKIPEFVTMMSVGNRAHVQTLVDLIEGSKFIVNEGDYYKLQSKSIPVDIYLALNDEVLLMTNNLKLVQKGMKNGISTKSQLNATNKELLSKNNLIAYSNISKIFEMIGDLTDKNQTKNIEMFTFFKNNTADFMTSGVSVTDNIFGTNSILNVPDKNLQAWYFFAKMAEDFQALSKNKR